MHPAALKAAHATRLRRHPHAARLGPGAGRDAQPERLVGLWALQRMHITPLWPSFLAAPPYNYSFLSNPVVDPEFTNEAIAGFFDAIERERSLPKVIRLRYLDASAETYPAIMSALAARGAQTLKLAERERPYVTKDFGLKKSGSTRKKLRQDWNRLTALGAVDIVNDRDAHRRAGSVRDLSRDGSRELERLARDRAALRRGRRDLRALPDLRSGGAARTRRSRCCGSTAAPIAAQVLLYCGTHRLHLEDRIRCRVLEVLARRAPGRQDDRAAVRRRRHRGDRVVLAGRRLHEPDLGRPAHQRRSAGRRRRAGNRSASAPWWRASAAMRSCAACATVSVTCPGRRWPGASAHRSTR